MVTLGLDIGSNSVGSAWVDTDTRVVRLGVGIFPAGVDETEDKRGSPINQKRREKRASRRSIARRAKRKHALRKLLVEVGLLPSSSNALKPLLNTNPWSLRREGLNRALTPIEFGQVLMHINQRRGAVGVETDPDDEDEGKVKEAIDHLQCQMVDRYAPEDQREWLKKNSKKCEEWRTNQGITFGRFMADLMDERRHPVQGKTDKFFCDPIRNRRDKFEFHAPRPLIHEEFNTLWDEQKKRGGKLAELLTADLRKRFDDPGEDDTWRHRGILFGQRRTYWDVGTLGRCDLEPTDQRCSLADMHAQEFRVLETINNLRIEERGKPPRPLDADERQRVLAALRSQKAGSVATVRKALGIDKKAVKEFFALNIERDKDKEVNTDWFYREIIKGALTESVWQQMSAQQREAVNRAILKFDPESPEHAEEMRTGAMKWWGLSPEAAELLISAWKKRPKIDKRINLSRRALLNLLPWLREGLSVSESRQRFAEDAANGATQEQRSRYALGGAPLSKGERHFLKKHPDMLPPAPTLANPVVRKAIHEVRRHVINYLREFGRKPDRIVIELTRSAKQSEKVRNAILAKNRNREAERKKVLEDFALDKLSLTQQGRAIERVLLCREQREMCIYSDLDTDAARTITERMASEGSQVEVDHIVPLSRSQDNSMNNKALCFRNANRNKGNKTAKEWLPKDHFERLCQRFSSWQKEMPRKWENLRRDVQAREDWANSQLTDTAYAATQVADYLRNALYAGDTDGRRRIFFTKGSYTAILRRDWQLQDDEGPKARVDHRHHAVDAVVIALTGSDIIQDLARHAEEQEKAKAESGHWPQRRPLDPPWSTVEQFRDQVMTSAKKLVVSHRPVKRKIVGYLHKEDLWGAVDEESGVFRIRCKISELTPKMLRLPVEESDPEVKARLFVELKKLNYTDKDARKKSREAFEQGRFKRRLVDPSLGKGGLVRDCALRTIVRECLRANYIDPDDFTKKQISDFASTDKLRMPRPDVARELARTDWLKRPYPEQRKADEFCGVPIKSVITIGPMSDPVKIAVKDPYTGTQAVNSRTGRPLFRYHFSRNNHHVEIRQHSTKDLWSGDCVTAFRAAQRVRPQKGLDGKRTEPKPAVDRSTTANGVFVMSLSEGETIHARRNDRPADASDAIGYYVVAKLDGNRIYFTPHQDARSADEQDRWDATYADLKACGPEPGKLPYKVRVTSLGEITPLPND